MNDRQVQLIAVKGNTAAVQIPGRHYPAIALAADAFAELVKDAKRVAMDPGSNFERRDEAVYLSERLSRILAAYETMMREQGLKLPYDSPLHG